MKRPIGIAVLPLALALCAGITLAPGGDGLGFSAGISIGVGASVDNATKTATPTVVTVYTKKITPTAAQSARLLGPRHRRRPV